MAIKWAMLRLKMNVLISQGNLPITKTGMGKLHIIVKKIIHVSRDCQEVAKIYNVSNMN